MGITDAVKDRLIGTPFEMPLRHAATLVRPRTPAAAANDLCNQLTIEVARRVLRPDSNTIDVGAHCGVILRGLMDAAPHGQHVAVEPLPRQAQALRRRFPGVTVHQIALADRLGVAEFQKVIGASEESSLVGMGHGGAKTVTFTVRVATLDHVAPAPVDFVKIDAEQAEWLILQGADRVLSQFPMIAFELGANQEEVYALLCERGYTVTRLADWLDGKPPPANLHALRHEVRGQHFFLAHR